MKPSTYRCFCRLPAATTHASSSHLGPSSCTRGGEAVSTIGEAVPTMHTSAVTPSGAVPSAPGGLGCLQLCLPLPIRACISAPVRTSSDTRRKLKRVSAGWRQRPGGTSDSRQAAAGPAHPRATAAAAWRACCPGAPAAAPRARTSAPPPPASRLHHQRLLVRQRLPHEHKRRPTTQPATVGAAAKLAGACDGAPASRDVGMSRCSAAHWAGGAVSPLRPLGSGTAAGAASCLAPRFGAFGVGCRSRACAAARLCIWRGAFCLWTQRCVTMCYITSTRSISHGADEQRNPRGTGRHAGVQALFSSMCTHLVVALLR